MKNHYEDEPKHCIAPLFVVGLGGIQNMPSGNRMEKNKLETPFGVSIPFPVWGKAKYRRKGKTRAVGTAEKSETTSTQRE